MEGGSSLYFNLSLFGRRVRRLRKQLKLTQSDLSAASRINIETIRRIEAGKVLPRLDTLEYLSPALKVDLQAILLKCRLDDYYVFHQITNRIEQIYDKDDIDGLHGVYRDLSELRKSINNEYYATAIDQLLLLISATFSYKIDGDLNLALAKLINSLRMTTADFSLGNYDAFVYTDLEIRLLMHMALVLNQLGTQDKYLEILQFCANHSSQEDIIYPKVLHNLAGAYIRNRNYAKALECTTSAIDWCKQNRNFTGLHLLYYNKGLCQFHLGNQNYADSVAKSVFLCEIYGYVKLRRKIAENYREVFRRGNLGN